MVIKRAGHKAKTSAPKVAPEATPLPLKVNPPDVSSDPQAKIEALRATILAQLQGQYPGVVALALGEALIASVFARAEDPGRVGRMKSCRRVSAASSPDPQQAQAPGHRTCYLTQLLLRARMGSRRGAAMAASTGANVVSM
ncbi:hypothetical protein [Metallibacterium scheffleri]